MLWRHHCTRRPLTVYKIWRKSMTLNSPPPPSPPRIIKENISEANCTATKVSCLVVSRESKTKKAPYLVITKDGHQLVLMCPNGTLAELATARQSFPLEEQASLVYIQDEQENESFGFWWRKGRSTFLPVCVWGLIRFTTRYTWSISAHTAEPFKSLRTY